MPYLCKAILEHPRAWDRDHRDSNTAFALVSRVSGPIMTVPRQSLRSDELLAGKRTTVGLSGPATGVGDASSRTAIAHPYFGGMPGIAPDHRRDRHGSGRPQERRLQPGGGTEDRPGGCFSPTPRRRPRSSPARPGSASVACSVSASVSNYRPVSYALAVPGAAPTSGVPAAVQPDPSVSQVLSVAVTVAYSVG